MITCSNNNDVKTGGHLGNQIMRIMALIGFSIKYQAFAVLPDWPYKQYFNVKKITFANEASTITDNMFDKMLERQFHYTPDYWDGQNFTKDTDLVGFFQSPKYWPEKLKFKDEYIDFVKAKYGFDDIAPVPTLAISVRRGDFVDHPDYYQLGIDYYLGALQAHFAAYEAKGRIFIFSDDITWCKQQFSHIENVTYIDASDIEQLACMTCCTDFIISNSTFSYVGAYLSGNGTVIRPKQNFRGKKAQENSEKDYWPAEWIIYDDTANAQSVLNDWSVNMAPANNVVTINQYFDVVFCINLKRRTDRKAEAQKQFDKFGITVEFVEAVDGDQLTDPRQPSADGTMITAKELACTQSHLKVLQIANNKKLRNYFVFEDDAEFDNDFLHRFSDYIKQLPADWDMVYMGGNHQGGTKMISANIARIYKTYTTHAYGVHNSFYSKMYYEIGLCDDKADVLLAKLHEHNNCYCLIPHIVFQLPSFSDIENKMVTNNHLRNTNNNGNHNFAYVALDPVAANVLNKFNYYNTITDLQAIRRQNLVKAFEAINDLLKSGTNIIFLLVNEDQRNADVTIFTTIKDSLVNKVAGKCFFVTINRKDYDYAEDLQTHFEANLNVMLHNADFVKFEAEISNKLKGYPHTKRLFPG